MLKDFFRSYVDLTYDKDDKPILTIIKAPRPYVVLYYAIAAPYTLIGWKEEFGLEPVYGETLWRGNMPISKDAGQMRLAPENSPAAIRDKLEINPWTLISADLSAYGLDAATGKKLRESITPYKSRATKT